MNVEDKIIALLNGDLANEAEVEELMKVLAGSSEKRRILLQHTRASHHIGALGRKTVPSAAAVAGVLERVAHFETTGAGKGTSTNGSSSGTFPLRRILGFVVMLGLGFLLGYGTSALQPSYGDEDEPKIGTKRAESEGAAQHGPGTADKKGYPLPAEPEDSSGLSATDAPASPLLNRPDDVAPNTPHELAVTTLASLISNSSSPGQILSPNGGEEFSGGDLIPLMWSGTENNVPVTLDISSDGGNTWEMIGEDVIGNRALWRVPYDAVESSRYLLRVAASNPGRPNPVLDTQFSTGNLSVNAVDFSPDGKTIALGTGTELILWDIATRTEIARMSEHVHDIYHVNFSPDGSKLVTASRDETVIIWNVRERTVAYRIDPGRGYVWQACFSPDGNTLATIARDDSLIVFWDVATGKEKWAFDHIHSRGMRFFDYTSDGTRLLTTSIDRSVAITDVRTGKVLQRVFHHVGTTYGRMTIVMGAQLTPDDSVLITCGYDGWVKFWNARTGELLREKVYHNGNYVVAIRLSRDGRFLTSVGEDGTAKVLDPYTGEVLAEMTLNIGETVSPMKQSRLGAGDRLMVVGHADGRVSLWDMGIGTINDTSDAFWSIRLCDDLVGVKQEKKGN